MIKQVLLNEVSYDDLFVIVPSKYELYYKKKFLNENINLLTLRNFLIKCYDGDKRLVKKEENFIIMYDSLKTVTSTLSLYKDDLSYSFVNELISTYKGYKTHRLKRSTKVQDLKLIYDTYEKKLLDSGLINEYLLYLHVLNSYKFNGKYLILNLDDMEEEVYSLIEKMSCYGEVLLSKNVYNQSTIKELYKLGVKFDNEKNTSKKVANYKVLNDISDEVAFVNNDISKKIINGASLDEFLIVTDDVNLYYPYFKTLFNHPFTKRYDSGELTSRFIQIFCDFLKGDFSSKNVVSLLKLGLTSEEDEIINKIDNYVYLWNLEDEAFYKTFFLNPSGDKKSFSESDIKNLEEINSAKERIVTPIKYLLENLLNETSVTEILKNIYVYLSEEKIIEKLFKNDYEGASSFINVLDYINDYLKDGNLKDVLTILLGIPFKCVKYEKGQNVVCLENINDAIYDDKKFVYVMNAKSDSFPSSFNVKGLLTHDDIKEEYLSILLEKHDDNEDYFFKKAILNPDVTITYHKLGTDLKLKNPSPYLKEAYLKEVYLDKFYDAKMLKMNYSIMLSEEKIEPFISEDFCKINKAKENDLNYKILKETASLVYGDDITLSPSQIEAYAKCPFYHFCEKNIKLKVREKYAFDNRRIGTFMHYVLERVLKNDFDKVNLENVGNLISKYTKEYLNENKVLTKKTDLYVIKKLGIDASLIIKNMLKEMDISYFKPRYFEFKIDDQNIIKPLVLKLDSGLLKVNGIADRIDVYEDDKNYYYRIIDYKTGDKKFRLDDVLMGLNLQMLLYLLAIKQNKNNVTDKKLIPSAILYYPAMVKESLVSRALSDDEKRNLTYNALKMNGIINKDEGVISALGGDFIGDFISVMTRGKINEEYLFDGDDLDAIFGKMTSVVKLFGNELKNGLIGANPIGGRIDSCAYCKYASVCRFDSKLSKKRKPQNFKNSEVIMMLEGDFDA